MTTLESLTVSVEPPPIPQAAAASLASSVQPPPIPQAVQVAVRTSERHPEMKTGNVLRRFGSRRLTTAQHTSIKQMRRKSVVQMDFLGDLKNVLKQQQDQQQLIAKQMAEVQDKQLVEVLSELLTTEATYLEDLTFTVEQLLRPLRDMLDARTHYTVFSNLEQLRELHAKLGEDLSAARVEGCAVQEQGRIIADAFKTTLPFFKMYAVYCGNQATAAGALVAAREDDKVDSFLRGKEKEPTSRATLPALLFRPVQRMCVYPLLFQQLHARRVAHVGLAWLKFAVKGHPQHEAFSSALGVVQSAVQEVNENVRAQEAHHHMLQVLTSEVVGGASVKDLIAAARSLEMEATVDMKSPTLWSLEWRVRRTYKWYVFNDMLLVCRPNRLDDGFTKKLLIPFDELDVSGPRGSRWRGGAGAGGAADDSRESADGGGAPSAAAPNRWREARTRLAADGQIPSAQRGSVSAWGTVLRQALDRVSGGEKPEVIHLRWRGPALEYKCWAESEAQMNSLVSKLHELQRARLNKLQGTGSVDGELSQKAGGALRAARWLKKLRPNTPR